MVNDSYFRFDPSKPSLQTWLGLAKILKGQLTDMYGLMNAYNIMKYRYKWQLRPDIGVLPYQKQPLLMIQNWITAISW